MCHCDTQPPAPNWLMWQWITVQHSVCLLLLSPFLQTHFRHKMFGKACCRSCIRTQCTVCVSQWWRGIFVSAKGSVTHLHPDTEFQRRTSEFQYGNSSQFSFSMYREICRHLRKSKRGRPLSQGSHKAVLVDSLWSPLSLLHYTPILQKSQDLGHGRNKSMLCPHPQGVPEVLFKAPLTSWAVVCRGVPLGSQLFLGKCDRLQDTTQPCPNVTLTSVRPSTCCPFHDSWDRLKSGTSDFVQKPRWLKQNILQKPQSTQLI